MAYNKKIICIGAGIQGERAAYYFADWGLADCVIAYIDNDSQKIGKAIACDDYGYTIYPFSAIETLLRDDTVFVIASLYYRELVTQLEKTLNDRDAICVCLDEVAEEELMESPTDIIGEYEEAVIPKVIHYAWVGDGMPDKIHENIRKWKELCPDYEFILWNEENYDFSKSIYASQAYQHHKWGFVPDVMRLDVVYRYGGIYLDTDIEMIKRPDDLLYQDCFASVDASLTMNLGSGFGAKPGCEIIKELRDYYDNVSFVSRDGKIDCTSCNTHSYKVLREHGYHINNRLQKIMEMNIYPMPFQGACQYTGMKRITPQTYWIHHGNMSWLN